MDFDECRSPEQWHEHGLKIARKYENYMTTYAKPHAPQRRDTLMDINATQDYSSEILQQILTFRGALRPREDLLCAVLAIAIFPNLQRAKRIGKLAACVFVRLFLRTFADGKENCRSFAQRNKLKQELCASSRIFAEESEPTNKTIAYAKIRRVALRFAWSRAVEPEIHCGSFHGRLW